MCPTEIPATMQAITSYQYGPPNQLALESLPVPTPKADEVLVKVAAVALNRADSYMLHGDPWMVRLAFGITKPKHPVLGQDYAGTVVATGANCQRLKVGDRVFGTASHGLAEYAASKESTLQVIPASLSFEDAAALAMAGTTALHAVQKAGLKPGGRVLVHGASGGVGSFVVQILAAQGMSVCGSCSAGNADIVRELGAESTLDYSRDALFDPANPWDAVIDCAGTLDIREGVRWLNPGGVLVRVGFDSGRSGLGPMVQMVKAPFVGIGAPGKAVILSSNTTLDALAEVAGMAAAGAISPRIEKTYKLENAREAFERLATHRTVGKLIVRVSSDLT